ncbi:MAG TPA: hypothetical protein VLX33_02860 [Nitrososphaerales archaeon]|nr:hypothetical protein [Nitrososphaerales archaeon]
MLHARGRAYFVASASVFAVVYAILGLFPVSAYVGVSSFLTFREVVSPLAGMLFGPWTGGFSMIIGNFVDFAFNKPVVFDYLDFVPDLASAVLAGLVFTGRRKIAIALPLALVVWYSLDPLSADVVTVQGVSVPFFWMHALSIVLLGAALAFEARGKVSRLSPAFVAATVFASTMTGHIAGSILYENIAVRVNQLFSAQTLQSNWTAVFYAYPAERILFTVLGTATAVPVLRAVTRRRGDATPAGSRTA